MTAPLASRRNLDFILYDWLDVEALLARPDHADHSRATFDALLDLSERLATEAYLPTLKDGDRHEPWMDAEGGVHVLPGVRQALVTTAEAGLFGAGFPAGLDGLSVPSTVYWAAMGLLKAASVGATGFMMLTVANARLIAAVGTPAQVTTFAGPQVAGRWFGTMCLSEPQAGSSLADISCRAEPDGEDEHGRRFRLRGNKMWISGGDHDAAENIVHLVLAKVPGADGRPVPGTRGISLFIVAKFLAGPDGGLGERNDIVVAGLNHKMGFRAIPNCLLNLGEGRFTPQGRAGAVGYLVGKVGEGLPIMFQMMNEARVGVGLGAAMLAIRGYQLAVAYAKERSQGRPLAAKGRVDTAPVPLITHPDVRRMLLAQKAYAEGALSLVLYAGRLIDEERSAPDAESRARAGGLLSLLTPVAKTWPSEWGLAANDLAIQVHGGYGYARDFDVEQLYRDNRLNPIHEGTTGIQGIDLLGRKILRERAASLGHLRTLIAATAERARSAAMTDHAEQIEQVWAAVGQTIDRVLTFNDDARALAHATSFLSAFGHAVVGWLWLDQAALCALAPQDDFSRGKIRACRFFFETELPRVRLWLDQVDRLSTTAADMPAEQF